MLVVVCRGQVFKRNLVILLIYRLNGQLVKKTENFVVLECGGVGFCCFVTPNTVSRLGAQGEQVGLYTYLNVKEDLLELYGFLSEQELETFKKLIGVSGVGAKFALSILSALSPKDIALNVELENPKAFTVAHGVGQKLAQRIVLELKGKLKEESFTSGAEGSSQLRCNMLEAISALQALGYSQAEAAGAIKNCKEEMPVEEIVKQGLKILSGQRQ